MSEELWTKNQPDDLLNQPARGQRNGHIVNAKQHIGCPMQWFKQVFPVVRGKNELAVALYIYRLHIVQHNLTVKVSNVRLLTELGINRHAKYRALRRLAEAGFITIRHHNARSLEVVFRQHRAKAKPSK